MEIISTNTKIVQQINSSDYWKDNYLFKLFIENGLSNVNWENVSDEIMLYLFLHDEPTLGKERNPKTKKSYFRDITDFISYASLYGGIKKLNKEHVQKYQYIIEEKNLATTTLRRKNTVIKQFLQYLYRNEIIKQDLTLMMKKVSIDKEQLVNRDLYDHEVKQLLNYFKDHNYFAYTLMYVLVSSGMRIAELASAKWSDLFYFHKTDSYFLTVKGKRDKERDVIIFKDVLEVIQEFRRRRGLAFDLSEVNNSAFFAKANGGHYNPSYLSNEFSNLILETHEKFPFIKRRKLLHENAEIKKRYNITPHTCRHYTAAFLADKGIDIKSIQDMLGHFSLMTTENYLRRKRNLEDHAGVKVGSSFL